MDPLPTLAAALEKAPAAPPQIALGAPRTDGLFEREVERAIERQDASGGERVLEARASAIRERRSDRRASFEHERPEQKLQSTDASERAPTQALVASPAQSPDTSPPTARGEAAQSSPMSPMSPTSPTALGGDAAPGAPTGQEPSAALPATLPAAASALARVRGVSAAASASVVTAAAPASASTPNQVTTSFLLAARNGGGARGATQVPVPAGDTALVEHAAEVLRQIRLALNPSMKRVVVELAPDELGRLTIKLATQDGRVSAVVRAESPATLELLERHLPELRAALAEGGVATGDIDLQLASDGRSREHAPPARHPAAADSPSSTTTATGLADEPDSIRTPRTPVDGSVDTYA